VAAQFRVLGTVEADVDGRMVDLGHVRQRSVLAVLLVEANATVSVEQLADRVWGDLPPRRVAATIYSYVSRLRRSLAGIEGVDIARRPGGYVFTVDPMAVDLHRFRRLVADARKAEPAVAVGLLDQALGLWHGMPFAGLDAPWLGRVRENALNERFAAELDRNDIALERGDHARLLADLGRRTAAHPFDERLAGQLMLALYRSGRQADALDHYERVRGRLSEELGVDPSPALQRLRSQLLSGDPVLAVAGGDGSPNRTPGGGRTDEAPTVREAPRWLTVPRQLPAPPSSFTGRSDQISELDTAMAPQSRGDSAAAIAAIGGSGGMGKSWLALCWAYRNMDRFPDGQLYLNLRGFDPADEPLAPEVALGNLLEALGVPASAVPSRLDAQGALFRSLTAGRRMLVLLDNARDSSQVVPLLPGGPSCAVLVTSRQTLTGLVTAHGARPVALDVLSDAEAYELLLSHLGTHRLAAEPEAVAALIDHCGGLPLALGIVAARAATRPEAPLSLLADELRSAATRLDALNAGEVAVNLRSVLSCSVVALGGQAARVCVLLGLAPGPDIGLPAVASLVAAPIARTRAWLAEVLYAHLSQEAAPNRYRMHDLVRLYLSERARSVAEYDEATNRVLDHYLHTAHAADNAIRAGSDPIPLTPARPGVVAEPITDHSRALDWFTAEHDVLVAAVEQAAAHGFDSHAWQLAQACQTFLSRREHWHDLLRTQRTAVGAAQRLADPLAQTYAHRGLGNAYIGLGRYEQAHAQLELALEFAAAVDEPVCLAHAHRGLGRLFAKQGRFDAALPHDERALEIYGRAANPFGQAAALNALGWHLTHLGESQAAVTRCSQALALYEKLGDRHGQALTWDSLGYARFRLGEHRAAVACYERAVEIFRELDHRKLMGASLVELGDVLHAAEDALAARGVWEEALRVYAELRDPAADGVRERLRRVVS
jgi:DNA-binding SARP family transcriptional activator/Tfp pilus assembly protein PilF